MGAVYKARQKELDRIVALKILPPGIGHDAAFAERFMVNIVGQDPKYGGAFIGFSYDAAALPDRQMSAVAVTRDGRTLIWRGIIAGGQSDGTGVVRAAGVRAAQFIFPVPLTDVAKFIIGTRPIRTMEWKNVVLPK